MDDWNGPCCTKMELKKTTTRFDHVLLKQPGFNCSACVNYHAKEHL